MPAELLFTTSQIEQIEAAERERKRLIDLRKAERVREVAKRFGYEGGPCGPGGGDGGGLF